MRNPLRALRCLVRISLTLPARFMLAFITSSRQLLEGLDYGIKLGVGPENLRRPIMLKICFRTAILRPYEPHFIFRDRFPDGRLPLPTFPTA